MARADSASDAFRNPLPSHSGALVFVKEGEAHPGYEDWTRPEGKFRGEFHFTHRVGPELVIVELGAAQAPPASGPRSGAK